MIREGAFREDLYYRLNIFELRLPPLRERMEDVPLLVDHFIRRLSAIQDKGIRGIAPKALRVLMGHGFPGNVRELQNAVEHAFVLSPGTLIRTEYLPENIRGAKDPSPLEGTTLKDQERHFILKALARNGYDRIATAEELGIHKSTLYRKIQKFGIELPPRDGPTKLED
jgi:DNA-binding NtrC family response regulator